MVVRCVDWHPDRAHGQRRGKAARKHVGHQRRHRHGKYLLERYFQVIIARFGRSKTRVLLVNTQAI
jgi:hypothetical protein